jgi:hypothetical protein
MKNISFRNYGYDSEQTGKNSDKGAGLKQIAQVIHK